MDVEYKKWGAKINRKNGHRPRQTAGTVRWSRGGITEGLMRVEEWEEYWGASEGSAGGQRLDRLALIVAPGQLSGWSGPGNRSRREFC